MANNKNNSKHLLSANYSTQYISFEVLIRNSHPNYPSIQNFYFYKQHLTHFDSANLNIQSDNFQNSDLLLFIRFIAASFSTGYDFMPSDKSNMARMRIHSRSNNKMITQFLDELEPFEIEQQFLKYLKEQLIIEKKTLSSPLSALILSLQRSCKIKQWHIKTSMAKSLIAVNQLIYRTT